MDPILIDLDQYAIPCLVLSDDKQEKCIDCNTSFLKTFSIENIHDKTLHDFWPDLNTSDLKQKFTIIYEENDTVSFFKPYVSKISYKSEKATLVLFSETTDLISTKDELENALEQASAAAEMKSNFLATMSHEIRTPMQSIFGLIELIYEESPSQRIIEMLNTAKESASGLLEILDDILDLAKMDADKMELDDFEVPIRLLARGTIEALAARNTGKKVALLDDISQDVPFVIKGDPKRLRQIIMNFMSNALKFTQKGSVTLKIHTETKTIKAPEDGYGLRFEVVDTGMGMPEAVRKKLFQPFTQADNSTARQFGGTGLGLSICKKLVELMNGEIGVDSVEGQGSTFWFEIPSYAVATDQTTVKLPDLKGVAVLSVEDHPQGGKEIENSLKSMGAEVVRVETYKDGLEMAKRRPFDIAVVDQGLPDGLGIDLLKECSEIRPFMGQVLYTVRDDYGLQHSCKSMGATYLAKPASRAGLGEAVKEAASKDQQHVIEGPRKLLIAEDTATVRDVLSRQLNILNAEADFVENGREAIDAFKTGEYGIVVTDLHMPEVDGYQVIQEIRDMDEKSNTKTPVIVLTADVQMAQRQAYLAEGFDECLLKPVSIGQFRRLLIRWGLLDEEIVEESFDAQEPEQSVHNDNDNTPAIIDLDAMKNQLGDVSEDTFKMIEMFLEMSEPILEKIKTAQADNDKHSLAEAAHSLKGGSRSACCMALGDFAEQLQTAAENNKDTSSIVDNTVSAFQKIRDELPNIKQNALK